jgi:hypothetical protein
MGFLHKLFGFKKKAVAPFQVTSNISPQENYAGYTQLPNIPGMGSLGDYRPDPNRLHAPFQVERGGRKLVTNGGVHIFDQGDPNLLRVPDQPLQQYFNEKKSLPPRDVQVPAHGVVVPVAMMKRGHSQTFVPEFGRRSVVSGVSPVTLLSTPINVSVRQTSFDGSTRAPITGAKAPKAKKGF